MKRNIYLLAGIIFMTIGMLGYILPILPGTIFMILAAYCFLYSSDTLYRRVVDHPLYGSPVKRYIENNYIGIRTKILILISMWIATLFSILYINPHFYFNLLTLFLSVLGSIMVLRAKS